MPKHPRPASTASLRLICLACARMFPRWMIVMMDWLMGFTTMAHHWASLILVVRPRRRDRVALPSRVSSLSILFNVRNGFTSAMLVSSATWHARPQCDPFCLVLSTGHCCRDYGSRLTKDLSLPDWTSYFLASCLSWFHELSKYSRVLDPTRRFKRSEKTTFRACFVHIFSMSSWSSGLAA